MERRSVAKGCHKTRLWEVARGGRQSGGPEEIARGGPKKKDIGGGLKRSREKRFAKEVPRGLVKVVPKKSRKQKEMSPKDVLRGDRERMS